MKYKYDDSPDKKGKSKHSHLLDLYDTGEFKKLTGTSSVVNVLHKPLSWWAASETVKTLGWIHPKIKKNGREIGLVPDEERKKIAQPIYNAIKKESLTQYVARLDAAYKAHDKSLDDSAKAGTDLHALLEQYVKDCLKHEGNPAVGLGKDYIEKIMPFVDWSNMAVKEFIYSEVHCFHEGHWIGGISDAGAVLKKHIVETKNGQVEIPEDTRVVIDFKSAKEAYSSSFIQGAGYALQVERNGLLDANGNQIGKVEKPFDGVVIVPFGAEVVYPEIRLKIEEYKEAFIHCLALYRTLGMDKSEYATH